MGPIANSILYYSNVIHVIFNPPPISYESSIYIYHLEPCNHYYPAYSLLQGMLVSKKKTPTPLHITFDQHSVHVPYDKVIIICWCCCCFLFSSLLPLKICYMSNGIMIAMAMMIMRWVIAKIIIISHIALPMNRNNLKSDSEKERKVSQIEIGSSECVSFLCRVLFCYVDDVVRPAKCRKYSGKQCQLAYRMTRAQLMPIINSAVLWIGMQEIEIDRNEIQIRFRFECYFGFVFSLITEHLISSGGQCARSIHTHSLTHTH